MIHDLIVMIRILSILSISKYAFRGGSEQSAINTTLVERVLHVCNKYRYRVTVMVILSILIHNYNSILKRKCKHHSIIYRYITQAIRSSEVHNIIVTPAHCPFPPSTGQSRVWSHQYLNYSLRFVPRRYP